MTKYQSKKSKIISEWLVIYNLI